MQEKHIIVLDEYFNIALQRVGRDIYTEGLNSKMIQETNIELFGIGLFYRLSCLKKWRILLSDENLIQLHPNKLWNGSVPKKNKDSNKITEGVLYGEGVK